MPRACHSGHPPGLQIRAIHDGGIQLILALGGKDRAVARVEQRIVLENIDGGLDCIQRRPAPIQHPGSGSLRLGQRCAIGRLAIGA